MQIGFCGTFFSFFLKDENYNSVAMRKCGVKLNVEDLMLKYKNIFWNSLWYFKLMKLEYDFMLPYEEGIEKKIDDLKLPSPINLKYLKLPEKNKIIDVEAQNFDIFVGAEKEKANPVKKNITKRKKIICFPILINGNMIQLIMN